MNSDCDNLDTYLDDELSADDATRFRMHLDRCEACREAVDEQGWIDGLLRSSERTYLDTLPAALVHSIRSSLHCRQRNRRLIAAGLAAAAALMLAVGWTVLLHRQADHGAGLDVAKVNGQPNGVVEEPSPNPSLNGRGIERPELHQAVVVGGPEMIVVPVASQHPDVTVVRVFPTYQPENSTHVSTEQTPATDNFVWPDDFNGG